MNRRRFIQSVGAAVAGAGLAGCIGQDVRSIGETVSVAEGRITLTDVRVEQLLPVFDSVHPRIVAEEGLQYVVFRFDVSGLNVDNPQDYLDQSVQWTFDEEGLSNLYFLTPWREFQEDDFAAVAFEVPAPYEYADGTTLRWWADEQVYWDATAAMEERDVRAKISDPPIFTVTDVSVPDVVADSMTQVQVTVENTGGTDGTFNAMIGSEAVSSQPVRSISVPAGETVTESIDVMLYTEAGEDESLLVDWGRDSRRVTVQQQ